MVKHLLYNRFIANVTFGYYFLLDDSAKSLDSFFLFFVGSSRYGAVTIASNSDLSSSNYNVMVSGSANHGVGYTCQPSTPS